MKSVFWVLAFLFSLVFLAAAYYVTSSGVRSAIDTRAPWVAGVLGPYVRQSGDTAKAPPKAPEDPAPAPALSTPPPAPAPVKPAEPEVFDLKKLATDRPSWPSKVAIKKKTEFPAVLNGKVVGALHAPAGTEVGLVTISGGKLGVEYQGGGAWLFVEETDLVARWEKSHH